MDQNSSQLNGMSHNITSATKELKRIADALEQLNTIIKENSNRELTVEDIKM